MLQLLIQSQGFDQLKLKSARFAGRNQSARPRPRLQHARRNSGLLQAIRARQAGNSPANHDYGKWGRRGNGHDSSIVGSECFGKQRTAVELLFFQVRVKHHRDITDKNPTQEGSLNNVAFHIQQAVVHEWREPFQFFGELLIEIDGVQGIAG